MRSEVGKVGVKVSLKAEVKEGCRAAFMGGSKGGFEMGFAVAFSYVFYGGVKGCVLRWVPTRSQVGFQGMAQGGLEGGLP